MADKVCKCGHLETVHYNSPQRNHCGSCLDCKGFVEREAIDHPAHYGGDSLYEHIKVVEAWGLGYALGNATKYIARAGKKTENPVEDLKKARWYLDWEI